MGHYPWEGEGKRRREKSFRDRGTSMCKGRAKQEKCLEHRVQDGRMAGEEEEKVTGVRFDSPVNRTEESGLHPERKWDLSHEDQRGA